MNDTPDPDRPAPRRRTRIALAAGVVVLLVAGAAVGGYFAGRSDRPEAAADPCVEVRQEMLAMRAEADANPDRAADITRVQANMVLQNPDCFPAKLRAAVQAGLDAADQQAAARALCGASDRPWWEC
ncbi:hypothetical protein [Streptomyces cyaneofuscatus]|uniref:hypothetical protein n=1 Tax=Streptomyces cyaneofuscatus TaxID=66883 RepID=UPI0036D912F6